jgi:DNA-3-methyladenine glycosylase II
MTAVLEEHHHHRDAERHLSRIDEDWAKHIARIGPCGHAPTPTREPYEALVRAVAHQQLHAKAANAILGRLIALSPTGIFPTPAELLHTDPALQLACGFSRNKLATIRGIATATLGGVVPDRVKALTMTDEDLIQRLSSLPGIGRWTVEMFLIYSLARTDILPADDFGVREGYRKLKGLDQAPTPRQVRDIGAAFSPYRTAASWYLWRCAEPRK